MSMNCIQRRDFLITAGALLAAPFAEAQQGAKIARLGFLGHNATALAHLREAFLEGLRDLGYVALPARRGRTSR
jgi:hypothetical protein